MYSCRSLEVGTPAPEDDRVCGEEGRGNVVEHLDEVEHVFLSGTSPLPFRMPR